MLVQILALALIKVEPYWNVNMTRNDIDALINTIKVEPYWNVNYEFIRKAIAQITLKQNHIGM